MRMTRKDGITRRQFLVGGMTLALAACAAPATAPQAGQPAAAPAAPAAAEVAGLAPVGRNRTLIMAGLGGEHPGAFLDVENFNLYAPGGISRSGMVTSATDGLFYANMLDVQEILPWAAESFAYNDDFTEVEVKLRKGVEWSDGTPFTANDCVFTINTL